MFQLEHQPRGCGRGWDCGLRGEGGCGCAGGAQGLLGRAWTPLREGGLGGAGTDEALMWPGFTGQLRGSTSVDGPPCPTPCVGVVGVPGPTSLRESTRDLGKGTWAGAGRGTCTGPPSHGHCCQRAACGHSRPRPGQGPHGAAVPGEVGGLAVLEPRGWGGTSPPRALSTKRPMWPLCSCARAAAGLASPTCGAPAAFPSWSSERLGEGGAGQVTDLRGARRVRPSPPLPSPSPFPPPLPPPSSPLLLPLSSLSLPPPSHAPGAAPHQPAWACPSSWGYWHFCKHFLA